MSFSDFQIKALRPELFLPLFQLTDAALAERGARKMLVDACPGFPCRVSLEDAAVGETVVLVHFEHQSANTPYRSAGAIFIREKAKFAKPAPGEIPEIIRRRLISVRAYDATGFMVDADVANGREIEETFARLFGNKRVANLHLHNAKPGCYACQVDRA